MPCPRPRIVVGCSFEVVYGVMSLVVASRCAVVKVLAFGELKVVLLITAYFSALLQIMDPWCSFCDSVALYLSCLSVLFIRFFYMIWAF